MSKNHSVRIPSSGTLLKAPDGALLSDVLTSAGIRLSLYCGGRGICGKCAVRVLRGKIPPPSEPESAVLRRMKPSPAQRLACMIRIRGDLEISIPAGSIRGSVAVLDGGARLAVAPEPAVRKYVLEPPAVSIATPLSLLENLEKTFGGRLRVSPGAAARLSAALAGGAGKVTAAVLDGRELLDAEPGETEDKCFGIAVDIGTSTVVMELVDLVSGRSLGRVADVNAQAPFGADVVSRITHVFEHPEEAPRLTDAIRGQINSMIADLAGAHGVSARHIYEVVIAGNTAMSHFFYGVPAATLAVAPFHGVFGTGPEARAAELGLGVNPGARVYAAPCIRSFVGGDIAAGLSAVGMADREGNVLFVDLGTNGEIVLKAGRKTTSTSTAAGPAFEGMTLSCGMPAFRGAVYRARWQNGLSVKTIGGGPALGVCGTGLIDVLAVALRRGLLFPDGRIADRSKRIPVAGGVSLSQADIRKLQLAIAAVKTGIRMMCDRAGLRFRDLDEILVAGAFGVSLDIPNARAIGLLPGAPDGRISFVGNSSLAGARKLLLSAPERIKIEAYAKRIGHVSLAAGASFETDFVEALQLKPYSGERS